MRARLGITNVRRLTFVNSPPFAVAKELYQCHPSVASCHSNPFSRTTVYRSFSKFNEPREDNSEVFDDEVYGGFDNDDDDDDDDNRSWDEDLRPRKKKKSKEATNRRIYLNTTSPLEDRVKIFLNQRLGEIHPLDIVMTSRDLIRECGKRNSFEGMKYAHDIMDRLIEEKRHFNQLRTADDKPQPYTIVIPERNFEVLMYGWSNLCRKVPIALQRMREVLDLMIKEAEYDETLRMERNQDGTAHPETVKVHGRKHSEVDPQQMFANMSCQPTVGIYNTLLNGLSQAAYRSISSANEAEDTLRLMERVADRKGWHIKPNTKSFMSVINAFARTQHPTAGDRAETVLRRMVRYHEQQVELYRDETGEDYDLVNPDNNSRKVVTPDTIFYTAVIQAHGESGAPGSTEKALLLLAEVLQSSNPNLAPDAYIFSSTINAFSKQAAKMKAPSARLQAAEAAEDVLWLMVDSIQELPDKSQNTYAVPFNTCMNCWANANLKESPDRAVSILQKMLDPEFSAKTGVKATTTSFNTCMQALSRASRFDPEAPKRAEDLLQLMEQIDSVDADVMSYTTIISAYAKSSRSDKVLQARRVLEALLTNLDAMPTRDKISAIPFTAALNAVASSAKDNLRKGNESNSDPFGVNEGSVESDINAYSIALKIYDEVCSDTYDLGITPDHLFFASMIDVIAKYTSPDSIERRQRLEQIFESASSSGELSSKVVESFFNACPSQEMFLSMLDLRKWPVESVNVFPREWTRKVPPTFKRFRNENSSSRGRISHGGNQTRSKPTKREKISTPTETVLK